MYQFNKNLKIKQIFPEDMIARYQGRNRFSTCIIFIEDENSYVIASFNEWGRCFKHRDVKNYYDAWIFFDKVKESVDFLEEELEMANNE